MPSSRPIRSCVRWLPYAVAFAVAAPALAQSAPNAPLTEVRSVHHGFEYAFGEWTQGGDDTRYVYLHMPEFWPHTSITTDGAARELPLDIRSAVSDFGVTSDGGGLTLDGHVRDSSIDGFIVVHGGRIVYERYPRMHPSDRHVWFSVSKTLVSTALAILEDRGQLDVTAPIDAYLGDLNGTSWEGVPVIDLLDMASGIDCPEVKSDTASCFWGFYGAFGWPEAARATDAPLQTVAAMGTRRPSGEVHDYTSVNTEVLAWLVEAVAGERFSDFVEREIWRRASPEADALVAATPNGDAFSAGGVSSRLRDLARYGVLFTPSGRTGEAPVISDAYLDKIQRGGRPELVPEDDWRHRMVGDGSLRHSTYQWDAVTEDGDFLKSGFGGQGLYVSPSRDLVVAWFGTPLVGDAPSINMFALARQLATSGLFDE